MSPGVQRPFTNSLKYCANTISQGIITKIGYAEYPFGGIQCMHRQYIELGCGTEPNRCKIEKKYKGQEV
jgi:hypothetical protein